MTKSDRLEMIASIASRRALPALLPVSEAEVVESVQIELASRAEQNDDSIIDSEYNMEPSVELVARLGSRTRDVNRTEHDSDYMLSRAEREEAAQDLWRYRHPVACWLAPISLFTNHEARLTA